MSKLKTTSKRHEPSCIEIVLSMSGLEPHSLIFKNGRIVTPSGVVDADLLIRGEKIAVIGAGLSGNKILDVAGKYLLPGFRDQHIHDHIGLSEDQSTERFSRVTRALVRQGVTEATLATFAAPESTLISYLQSCKEYVSSDANGVEGTRISGINVEGTFIRKDCAGAQPPEYIFSPNSAAAQYLFDRLHQTGALSKVNIVTDFGVDLIRHASNRGILVGSGHTKTTAQQLKEGMEAGLKYIVHFTNGPTGQSFKPFDGGGTYEGGLTLPIVIEIIADGYHVDWRYVSDIIERRIQQGREHEIILVTDGIFPIPKEIPEHEFRVYSTQARKSDDGGVFFAVGTYNSDGKLSPSPKNTLCSSLLTMSRGFVNLLNLFSSDFSGFMIDRKARSLEESLRLASLFTATNQARLEGVLDRVGSLDVGKLADITILEMRGSPGDYELMIPHVMVAGKLFTFQDDKIIKA